MQCWYIAKQDLKHKYQEPKSGVAGVETYIRAVEEAIKKIGADYHIRIQVTETKLKGRHFSLPSLLILR